nr:PAS domain-containing protein [Jannaschia sp. Os4]
MAQAPFAALLFRPDADLTLIWRNAAHARMSGSIGREVEGRGMFEAFPPGVDEGGAAAMQAIRDAVATIRETRGTVEIGPYRYDLLGPDGTYAEHHWQMQMSPVVEAGALVAVLQVARDVTEAVLDRRMAATLRRAAATAAGVSQFAYDPETDRFERTAAVDEMFGFAPGEAGPMAGPFFARVHPDDLAGVQAEVARVFAAPRGEVAAFDYRVPQADGTERYLRIRAEIAVDPDDRREKLVGTFIDLTDIEADRRQLQRELELRRALVREANHRIKNSLAIALAMLRLERRGLARAAGGDADAVLAALEARLTAISSAHGLMQLDGDRTDVSLHALVEGLAVQTRASAGLAEGQLRLAHEGADRRLDSDRAVSLGIVLNELLTNALKYGMDAGGDADIAVTVRPAAGGTEIVVANRIEAERPLEAFASTQVGSALVRQVAGTLGATPEAETRDGRYVVRLVLPA